MSRSDRSDRTVQRSPAQRSPAQRSPAQEPGGTETHTDWLRKMAALIGPPPTTDPAGLRGALGFLTTGTPPPPEALRDQIGFDAGRQAFRAGGLWWKVRAQGEEPPPLPGWGPGIHVEVQLIDDDGTPSVTTLPASVTLSANLSFEANLQEVLTACRIPVLSVNDP